MQTKRRRLVAETADDLQQILFGEVDEEEVQAGQELQPEQQQAVVPVARPDEEVEIYSDSDRDSMDEFIVRDTNEDREHRFIQSYSDRYGDDVAESLNDVITIFGDLRILDIYSGSEAAKLKRIVPEIANETLESQYDPEEIAAQFASSRDDLILETDCSERMQEEFGTAKCLETFAAFEEGMHTDVLEAEWAIEARWIHETLKTQYRNRDKGKEDWSLWSPAKLVDPEVEAHPMVQEHSALLIDEYKEQVVKRIHVALRDMKGRGFEPLYMWNSMAKAKYTWYVNLEDLQAVQSLDASEWPKLWSKYGSLDAKLQSLLAELSALNLEPESIQQVLSESMRSEIATLLGELRQAVTPESLSADLNDTLDDISLSISAEIEPVVRFVSAATAIVPVSTARVARRAAGAAAGPSGSLVATIIGEKLHEALIPLLTLSPREIGENLSIGAKIHKGPFQGVVAPPAVEPLAAPALRLSLVEFLSSTIASNLKVRRWFRQELLARASISTHPTGTVSATRRLYPVRRLCMKPVSEFFGTEVFLAVHSLVAAGELSLDLVVKHEDRLVIEGVPELSEHLLIGLHKSIFEGRQDDSSQLLGDGGDVSVVSEWVVKNAIHLKEFKQGRGRLNITRPSDLVVEDPLLADLIYYLTPESSYREEPWLVELRALVARATALKLYKTLKAELLAKLAKDSSAVAARNCAANFSELLRMKPFDPRPLVKNAVDCTNMASSHDARIVSEIVRRKMGYFSVLSVVVEKLVNGFRCHCVFLNHRGDASETVALDALLTPAQWTKKEADQKRLGALLKRHLPSLVIIAADDRKARSALAEMKTAISTLTYDKEYPFDLLGTPAVHFGDVTIPGRVAKLHATSVAVRTATSLGRFQQSPIAETLSLWSAGRILSIPLHELQSSIPKKQLLNQLHTAASSVAAHLGVDINDCVSSDARSGLLQFVPGLGPRKARRLIGAASALVRGLDGSGGSRAEALESILGKRVFQNAQAFLKLVPDCDKLALAVVGRDRADSDSSSESSESSDSESEDSASSDSDVDVEKPADSKQSEWKDWSNDNAPASSSSDWKDWGKDSAPAASSSSEWKDWNKESATAQSGEWQDWNKEAPAASSQQSEWKDGSSSTDQWKDWNKDGAQSSGQSGEWQDWKKTDTAPASAEWQDWKKADAAPASDQWQDWKKTDETPAADKWQDWKKDSTQSDWKDWKSTSAPKASSEWSYFGIANGLVKRGVEGYHFFDFCRFGKESWAVAQEVVAMAGHPGQDWLFKSVGDSYAFDPLRTIDFNPLLDAMFDSGVSANLPAYLADPEIDLLATKAGARGVIESVIIPQLAAPFADALRYDWKPPSRQRVFYACIRESEAELNKWSAVTCTATEVSGNSWIKATEVSSGLEGWVTKGKDDWARYSVGDSILCRITDIDFMKFGLTFSTEPISDEEVAKLVKWAPWLVVRDSDIAHLTRLGRVEVAPDFDASRTLVKSRRIIKHESYFEISHAAAVERLAQAPIGDVIFRPSASHPGQYLAMIKIMGTADSRDPSKEDWIKVFRFTEAPSSRTQSGKGPVKTIFRLVDGNEEFDEFDQMKVLYVDKYLRYLHELRTHPKFKPESIDQVRNTIIAKFRMNPNSQAVTYFFAMDDRRELAGNGVLVWAASGEKAYQDPIEVTNKGFKWWTKGPYPSLNHLLNWWKQGGYKERAALMDEWTKRNTK